MQLPNDFVYLRDVDPTIIQSVRYSTSNNFVGRIIDGYNAQEIILTRAAAEALQTVQKYMNAYGYSLVAYDGYRPQIAVDHFIAWSQDFDESQKTLYYPTIDKQHVFSLGYVATRSSHSRGSTVDLSIVKLGDKLHDIEVSERGLLDGSNIPFLDDGTVDMGSSFDLFHPASHHDSHFISSKYLEKRNFLRKAMENHRFCSYTNEWWHYTLKDEPYLDRYFNFIIRRHNYQL